VRFVVAAATASDFVDARVRRPPRRILGRIAAMQAAPDPPASNAPRFF